MSLNPGILPSPALKAPGRRSRLLFHWAARDVSLTPRTKQTPTLVRASPGGAVLDSADCYWLPVHSQPRFEMLDLDGDGVRESASLVIEDGRINVALWSSDFSQSATWTGDAFFTQAVATSIIAGQVARRHTNDNLAAGRLRTQAAGVLSAAGDVTYVIIENVDALVTRVGLRDTTGAAWVHVGDFTWATRAFATAAGSGTLAAVKLAEVGPNGGPVYLLAVSGVGTAGNNKALYIYPSGTTQNGEITVLHHAQLEEGKLRHTSPMVTGAATFNRVNESLFYGINFPVQTLTLYHRVVSPGVFPLAASTPGVVALGTAANATWWCYSTGTNLASAIIGATTGTTSSISMTSIVAGDVLEILMTLRVVDGLATAQLEVARNGVLLGTTAETAAVVPAATFAAGQLRIGYLVSYHIFRHLESKVAAGVRTMDQMREAQ